MAPLLRCLALVAMSGVAFGAPSPQADAPAQTRPTIDNMTSYGPGCPVGSPAIIKEFRGSAPVVSFPDWGLSLAEAEVAEDGSGKSMSKFCTQQITLSHIPSKMAIRLESVTVAGHAELEVGSTITIGVETRFGDKDMGSGTISIGATGLTSDTFNTTIGIKPELWSDCIDASGKLPTVMIKTTVSLNATRTGDKYSGGTVGGGKSDMKKALIANFTPKWKAC